MGHSDEINENVYQCPLAIKEITSVGGFLQTIDGKTHGLLISTILIIITIETSKNMH